MACELGLLPCVTGGPERARVTWRVLRTFRQVREALRNRGRAEAPLERVQYAETAERTGLDPDTVRAIVDEWILRRPLRHVRRFRRVGLVAALEALEADGLHAGVFSDYPAADKVAALGIDRFISVQVCATDADVNAFKPHPRGFLAACDRWGFRTGEVVYVGDRIDVDAAGAAAAGLSCVIVGRSGGIPFARAPVMTIRTMRDLRAVVSRLGAMTSSVGASPAPAEH
jgi:FMN phosphatase YigB (HAD superfamily)